MDEKLRQPYQGQLIKFTNVVKGWQSRWFILDPENGTLQYYLNEGDKYDKARGSIQLAGAVISPSDEDSLTFTVSPAVGESYKLRAHDTRDRQMWINRLRITAEMHTRAIAHHHPPLAPREHRIKDGAGTVQPLWASPGFGGLDVLDAFTQVAEILEESQRKHSALAQSIEELPSFGPGIRCIEPSILMIKATSQATLICLDQCLGALRSRHSAQHHLTHHHSVPVPSSSHHSRSPHRSSTSIKSRTAPQSPAPGTIPPSTPVIVRQKSSSPNSMVDCNLNLSNEKGSSSSLQHTNIADTSLAIEITKCIEASDIKYTMDDRKLSNVCSSCDSDSEVSDAENTQQSLINGETPVEEGQRSVIMHIISQLRLGMDLTRVTLPTFILEKRSLLEMFADFLGHPDLFLSIANCKNAEERILAVARWYLTSIHVGRQGSVAKKPYNPIIGEVFHCTWKVPACKVKGECSSEESNCSSESNKFYTIKYSSEQVSHHPPVSAFYIECPEKEMCINAHIWTKSKFMGMSVGVNLIGNISLVLGQFSETYHLAMPSAYARSVLMEPWVELGGRVNIHCPQTGCSAPIIFHTKPFYGGKLHKVTCEVKNGSGIIICRIYGEWDSFLEVIHEDDKIETINVKELDMVCHKRVRPSEKQAPNESRFLWHDVTKALSEGDLETATNHKKALEDIQRAEEQQREATKSKFVTNLFSSTMGDNWVYKKLPKYASPSTLTTQNNSFH